MATQVSDERMNQLMRSLEGETHSSLVNLILNLYGELAPVDGETDTQVENAVELIYIWAGTEE
jgi:hypothetical protein